MNEEQCRSVLVELANAFPKSKPLGTIDDQVALWMRHYRPIPIDDMIKAVMRIVDRESYFPTIKEFGIALQAVTDRPLPTSACQCDGIGYYEVTRGQWIPCPACLPGTNKRWTEGHFAPGHWCEECARAVRGEGAVQVVDERSLVQKPQGRKLTREENLDRLAIVQKLVAEMKATPKWNSGMTRAEIDKHWEDRFNALIRGDSDVDPEILRMFDEDPGAPNLDLAPQIPSLVMDVREPSDHDTDDEGFEIL